MPDFDALTGLPDDSLIRSNCNAYVAALAKHAPDMSPKGVEFLRGAFIAGLISAFTGMREMEGEDPVARAAFHYAIDEELTIVLANEAAEVERRGSGMEIMTTIRKGAPDVDG